MWGYRTCDVARLLGVPEERIRSWARGGLVRARRGRRGEFRFGFQDVVLLRAAAGLAAARVPPRRLRQALRSLREQLPEGRALASISIAADGKRLVVSDGRSRWHPESGQAVLDFSVGEVASRVAPLFSKGSADLDADGWYSWGCDLEDGAPAQAQEAYRRALTLEPLHAAAHLNLGRLRHEAGDAAAAETHYRKALEAGSDNGTALFNLGVALGDQGRLAEALAAYERALDIEPRMSDAHHNAARLCERLGRHEEAIRHLRAMRQPGAEGAPRR